MQATDAGPVVLCAERATNMYKSRASGNHGRGALYVSLFVYETPGRIHTQLYVKVHPRSTLNSSLPLYTPV